MERFYDSKETMPLEKRGRYFDEQVARIAAHAYENAPGMRERMDDAGVTPSRIRCVAELDVLPILSKDELPRLQSLNPPFGGFLGIPLSELDRVYVLPGPIYVPGHSDDYKLWAKSMYPLGLSKEDIVLNTTMHHLVPGALWHDEAFRALGVMVIPTGPGNSELQVKLMHQLGVTVFDGFISFLNTLIETANNMGYIFQRDFKLCRAVLGGEMYPELRATIEQDYGIQTTQVYGTADIGPIGYECNCKSGMHIPEEVVVEIIDPETGQRLGPGAIGQVVVTRLDEVYPLIRFGTGDLSSYTDEPCPCGRTSNRLLGIAGRVGEAVKAKGMFLHPKEVEAVLQDFKQITRCQVRVSRSSGRDNIAADVECASDADREWLREEFSRRFKEKCRLKLDKIEFVPSGSILKGSKLVVDDRRH